MKVEISEQTFNVLVQLVNSDIGIPASQATKFAIAQQELQREAEAYNTKISEDVSEDSVTED